MKKQEGDAMPYDAMVYNIVHIDALPVCSTELMAATCTDSQWSKVLQYVRKGWPEKTWMLCVPSS